MVLSKIRRWLVEPVWTAAPAPEREEWCCPACGRTVWRDSPAMKGIWFAPTDLELTGRCARQHGAHHRRSGEPLPPVEPAFAVEDDRRVAVAPLDGGAFVALLPPAGLLFLPAADGRPAFDVHALDELSPSDLVGRGRPHGRHLGIVPADEVAVDADGLLALPPAITQGA